MSIDAAVHDESRGYDCRIVAALGKPLDLQWNLECARYLKGVYTRSRYAVVRELIEKALSGGIDDIAMPARLDKRDARIQDTIRRANRRGATMTTNTHTGSRD